MEDPIERRPGASGRRWEERFRVARERRGESEPSRFEQRIAQGMEGEEMLGAQLTALAQEMDLGVLHDLALRGEKANIDHLVIGPAGVTVVDAKCWRGHVSFGRDTLWQGRRNRHKQIVAVADQVERVRSALTSSGCSDVPVDGLLCMVNANTGVPPDRLRWVAGVGVGTIPNVRRHAAREGAFTVPQIRQLHDMLVGAFVVSGGGYQPSLTPPPYAPEGDQADRLLARINQGHARERASRGRRRWFRIGLLGLLLLVVLTVVGSTLDPGAGGRVERGALETMRPELHRLAVRRAGGRVRALPVRETSERFVLRYRRGRRCRVRIVVARATGDRAVRVSNCRSRR